jgi:hypothetical protein
MTPEHDWQGLVHEMQDPLTKNLVISAQLKQYVELLQVEQGSTHVLHTEVDVLG